MRPTYHLEPAVRAHPATRGVSRFGHASRGLRHIVQRVRDLLPRFATLEEGSTAMASVYPARPAPRHVILFLAANPSGTTRLALEEECAAIERELRRTTGSDDFDFRSRWAVSVDEVMRALNELQPAVIHFSGHGGGSTGVYVHDEPRQSCSAHRDIGAVSLAGIELQDEQRQPQHVSARALAQMIESAAPSARLV